MPATDLGSYPTDISSIQQNTDNQNTLSEKIANTLMYHGYDHYSVQKVKKLVSKNTVVSYSEIDNQTHRRNVVETILLEMLNSSNIRINSNEPVLLIEFTNVEKRSRSQVEDYKNLTLETLASKYYIWPVRVFTARTSSQASSTGPNESLKLSLLNVVNTEIGSPNMVQLLELYSPAGKWDYAVISTEAFDQRNFLWRSDKYWGAADDVVVEEGYEVISNTSPPSEHDSDVEVVKGSKADLEVDDLSESLVNVVKPEVPSSDVEEVTDDATEEAPIMVEHPAMTELLVRDAARPHIQHPTWQHPDEGTSLLDLVTSHLSRLTSSSEGADIFDHSEKV